MPSSPPTAPTVELGHVASWSSFAGTPNDPGEETPELQFPNSVAVYDRMRRQDAQVRATYWALTLPLRRNIWALDPGQASEEVVSHLSDDLDLPILGVDRVRPQRRKGRFSWAEHIRLALLDLVYGFLPFEQVYVVEGDRVHLRKLAPRFPSTIAAINVAPDGGLVSIEQFPAGVNWRGTTVRGSFDKVIIPVDRLVYYVNDREGASWQGTSIFRPCYKHWLLKDRGMRTQAMSLERTGMGVPVINAPERATQAQITELDAMARNYRAGESAGGALPFGAKLNLVGITGTVPDALPVIHYHDEQIARAMLAQFLQFGTAGNSGNRALVSGILDFFALAVDGIADRYCSTTTQHVVEDLVDLNWGPDEPSPTVVARSIDAEQDIDPQALVQLIQVGAITMDDDLESWLRGHNGLPGRGVDQPGRTFFTSAPPFNAAPAMARSHRPTRASRPVRGHEVRAAKMTRRRYLDAIAAHYAPRITDALEGCVDVRAVVSAFAASLTAARSTGRVSAASARERARRAVEDQDPDLTDVGDVLVEEYGDAYVAGGHAALTTLPGDSPVAPGWDSMVDWQSWAPGLAATAIGLALADGSRGLADLTGSVADVLDGLRTTTIDRLTDALVEGSDAGESQARLVVRLEAVLADGTRAETIALTEGNRSMATSTTDAFRDNGIAGREWVALDDPCPECQAMDGLRAGNDEQFPDGNEIPQHPSCLCSYLPITAAELASA